MADISTTNKKARVPILGENGRISDAYLPQAVIDAEASSKTYAENAKSYSELVKKDAESAASSAASAKESADAAREGISSIDEKVTQAGQFAEAASSSATEANNYLEQVTAVSNTVSGIASSVAENAQVAETFANKSKESAASALTASTNAVNAKVDAEGYRDSAKSYSDNAKADADTAKNILESVKAQKADVDSTVQQFNTDATEYDTKFKGYVSEARESKEASASSATSASESAENASASATNASTSADKAKTSADAAALSATNAANSAKEAADNLSLLGASTLTRKEKDTFIHVDDAFPTKLLGIEIEGATEQVTTAGKNLLDYFKLSKLSSSIYAIENENLKVLATDYRAWGALPTLMTLKAGTYCASGAYFEICSASDNSYILSGEGKFTLNKDTEVKVKVGTNLSSFPVVVKVQIEMGNMATAYEPYTGGKPSPSPDYPQEIKVVENPTLKVTGRNLFDGEIDSTYGNSVNPTYLSKGTYTISLLNNVDWWSNSVNERSVYIHDYYSDVFITRVDFTDTVVGKRSAATFNLKDDVAVRVYSFGSWKDDNVSDVQIEQGDVTTEYKPYVLQLQAFTLPAEHPYLAKLPDGMADEIVVDREGNVELVARVKKILPKDEESLIYTAGTSNAAPYISFAVLPNVENKQILCSSYKTTEWSSDSGFIYSPNHTSIVIRDDRFTSKEKAIELLDGVVVYTLAKLTRYMLGKIEMLKAQESIMNMWTDAEVTPMTGTEYVRDVNIVVSNLEEAIASITQG